MYDYAGTALDEC